MGVRTWVGRFAIVQGQAQEEGPHLRSFPRQRPDEEEDELYVLVEPASPGSEEYTGQLVDAIGRLYQEDSLSLTGALLRSLKAAHQQLLQWNQRSLREHQVGAGASCLAVRGRTAYLAQAGPAVAYHVGDGRFQRVEPQDGTEPLGRLELPQPEVNRYQLSPGDLLLLASPRIRELLDEDTLRSILLQGANRALVELFRLARGQQEFSLVLLACVVEPEGEPAAGALAPAAGPAAVGPPPLEGEEEAGKRLVDAFSPAATPVALAEEETSEASLAQAAEAATPPEGLAEPPVRLKGDEANIRYPRTTGVQAGLPRIPLQAIAVVVVLAAVGLAAWLLIPDSVQESRDEDFASLLEKAEDAFQTAQTAADPDLRRQSLNEAEQKLLEADGIRSDQPAVAQLRARVGAALAELNAVLELPPLDLIVDVSERVPGPVSSGDLTIGGGGAYFLDREQGRVIAVSLLAPNPEPVVLFSAGEVVGAEVAGQPQYIAWADAPEGQGGLLILDDARRLILARFGQPPALLPVRDAQALGSADGIAHFEGNLYVLDRAGGQVWRYLPAAEGFDSERQPLLPPGSNLEQVSELAVSDALYLVLADGSVQRFQGTAPQLLTMAGIDRGLESPASLVPLPASNRLFIVDRGNKRIVVLSAEGVFRQQLKSQSFVDLRAIAVDEPNNLLYILVGGALYRTALPEPPPAS